MTLHTASPVVTGPLAGGISFPWLRVAVESRACRPTEAVNESDRRHRE